jgi:hypothetical protein
MAGLVWMVPWAATACAHGVRWERQMGTAMTAYHHGRNGEAEAGLLAYFYAAQGKLAEAEPLYQRALKIRERAIGPKHPALAPPLEDYAALLHASGRETAARAIEAAWPGSEPGRRR